MTRFSQFNVELRDSGGQLIDDNKLRFVNARLKYKVNTLNEVILKVSSPERNKYEKLKDLTIILTWGTGHYIKRKLGVHTTHVEGNNIIYECIPTSSAGFLETASGYAGDTLDQATKSIGLTLEPAKSAWKGITGLFSSEDNKGSSTSKTSQKGNKDTAKNKKDNSESKVTGEFHRLGDSAIEAATRFIRGMSPYPFIASMTSTGGGFNFKSLAPSEIFNIKDLINKDPHTWNANYLGQLNNYFGDNNIITGDFAKGANMVYRNNILPVAQGAQYYYNMSKNLQYIDGLNQRYEIQEVGGLILNRFGIAEIGSYINCKLDGNTKESLLITESVVEFDHKNGVKHTAQVGKPEKDKVPKKTDMFQKFLNGKTGNKLLDACGDLVKRSISEGMKFGMDELYRKLSK